MDGSSEPGPQLARAARGVLLCIGFLGVPLLAYALNRFRTLTDARALGWYALAVGILAFGLLASRLPPARRIALALLCAGTGAALLLSEWAIGTLRRAAFVRTQLEVAAVTGVPYDERSVPQTVRDLWRTDSGAMPSIVPKVLIEYTLPGNDPRSRFDAPFVPLGGVSGRQTVQLCNENGAYPLYRSDERGFLNPKGTWMPRPRRLVIIGDSFVHGYCVPADSSMPAHLRRRWPATVNLGSGGSGPLAELGTLVEYALPLRPSIVVWSYFENDLTDLRSERRHPLLMRYLEPGFSQGLIGRQSEIDSAVVPWVRRVYGGDFGPRDFEEHGLRQLLTLNALRSLVQAARAGPRPDPLDQLPLLREVLTIARDRTRAEGSAFLMLHLPGWERFFDARRFDDGGARQALLAVAAELGIPLLDLTPVFDAHRDRASLYGRREIASAHYSAAGYRVVAEFIQRGLDSLGLTPRLEPPDAH